MGFSCTGILVHASPSVGQTVGVAAPVSCHICFGGSVDLLRFWLLPGVSPDSAGSAPVLLSGARKPDGNVIPRSVCLPGRSWVMARAW